jgi:hypothetical protein
MTYVYIIIAAIITVIIANIADISAVKLAYGVAVVATAAIIIFSAISASIKCLAFRMATQLEQIPPAPFRIPSVLESFDREAIPEIMKTLECACRYLNVAPPEKTPGKSEIYHLLVAANHLNGYIALRLSDLHGEGSIAQKAFWDGFERAAICDNKNIREHWNEHKRLKGVA